MVATSRYGISSVIHHSTSGIIKNNLDQTAAAAAETNEQKLNLSFGKNTSHSGAERQTRSFSGKMKLFIGKQGLIMMRQPASLNIELTVYPASSRGGRYGIHQ